MATWMEGACPSRVSLRRGAFTNYTEFRYVTLSLLIHASGSPLVARAKKQNSSRLFCSTTAVHYCSTLEKACDSVHSICGEPTLQTPSSFHFHLPICHTMSCVLEDVPADPNRSAIKTLSSPCSLVRPTSAHESSKFDALLPASNFPIKCRWSSWQPPKYEEFGV